MIEKIQDKAIRLGKKIAIFFNIDETGKIKRIETADGWLNLKLYNFTNPEELSEAIKTTYETMSKRNFRGFQIFYKGKIVSEIIV